MLWYTESNFRTRIMSVHPEINEGPVGDILKAIGNADTCDVWCKGCNDWRKMNAAYAAIIKTGEIKSCGRCYKK